MPKRTPKPAVDEAIGLGVATDPIARLFLSYWRGEMNLWGAFWVWGMGVGTLVGLFFTLISIPVWQQVYLNFATGDALLGALSLYALLVMYGFWLSYYTWHVVGVWRCGAHSPAAAKWASRLFVLAVTFTYWPIHALNVWVRFF